MPFDSKHLASLTDAQRAQLLADPELAEAFEAGVTPFLPKPVGVCWSGMTGETWVPVEAVFHIAECEIRWARRAAKAERRAA